MKFIGFILLFLAILPIFAQTKVSYGAKIGFNLAQHYGTKDQQQDYTVKTSFRSGISTGAYLDLHILPNFSLGYELLYSMKGSHETIIIKRMEIDGIMEDLPKPAEMKVKYYLDYLEVPILLKVNVLDNNRIALSAVTGTAMSLKVKGYHELSGIVYFPDGEEFSIISINEDSKLQNVNMFDYSFIYGGVLEYKSRIPILFEYRFTLGWDYLSLPTYQFFEPVQLRNQTYSLLIGTRF
ncbi:MAG: outer membrane beta-barrel protein [Candidatus Cloacimonetes bacterium]|nr:outer membrane beta-barrel protein [Candidatus Cloacimonadota bacterium]